MHTYIFKIHLYDLASMATLFCGLMLALLLGLAKRVSRTANLFLSAALAVMVLKTSGLTPLLLPALGPLLYFYVQQLTCLHPQFRRRNMLHFLPLLAAFWMPTWLVSISILIYLYLSHRLIEDFYHRLQPVLMDKPRFAFRRLGGSLHLFGLFCLLSLFYDAFYLAAAVVLIAMAVEVILKSDREAQLTVPITDKWDAREKSRRLKEAVAVNRLYEDAELTLATLAQKLKIHPHDLSRIINTGLEKNFSDFINEFRVREVAYKMQDPANDRLTILAIAYDAGFNSKTTFNRVFKEMTGKTPVEYKNSLQNEVPIDKMAPRVPIRPIILRSGSLPNWAPETVKRNYMFRSYFKIAWRNVTQNKASSFINISGLAVGMAVAMLIALWIWDELSFNTYHNNYNSIAQVLINQTLNGNISTGYGLPAGTGLELRKSYGGDFKYVVMSSFANRHVLAAGDKKISSTGNFMEPDAPKLFSLKIIEGTGNSLADPSSILLSQSLAKSIFSNADCVGETVKMDDKQNFKVTGVYEDPPANTSLYLMNVSFIGPWSYHSANVLPNWVWNAWGWDCAQLFVQINDHADMAKVSAKIKNAVYNLSNEGDQKAKPALLLHPMRLWHLYQYKNGVLQWGKMQYVRLFGIIGVFVLLLACINFMNLSTARSEKRAKEVGIRKAVGSLRAQLIKQFFCESLLIAVLSFMLCLLLVLVSIPWFNNVSSKHISIPWQQPLFWLTSLGFTIFTGVIAGSYPAFYLSSFNPVKVLKGTFKAGPFAAIPRKVLVVVQFTVSTVLIIGTIVVFKQIEFAQNRPIGYSKNGLVNIAMINNDLHRQYNAFTNDLLASGAVADVAESTEPVTSNGYTVGDLDWTGKDPAMADDFGIVSITPTYGKTVGWQFVSGRDFSTQFLSDSNSIVLNEAAVEYMGLKKPVGQTVKMQGNNYIVIGVVKNMVMNSPYEPVKQTIFNINKGKGGTLNIKINPNVSAHQALTKIEAAFKRYSPDMPFSYKFADEEYAKKFDSEERIGQLTRFFAALAIFISCLGLFGMASFMAEQRVKEIGVRKVLGASIFELWHLLSKDFVTMVIISLFIAIPLASWVMYNWLQNYTYRTGLSWWVFAVAGLGALLITLATVSYQSIKAALANPVKSLRTE